MSPRLSAEQRQALRVAQARVAEILDPMKEEERRRARKARKERRKAAPRGEASAVPSLRQREPRQLDPDYLAWVRSLPCTACVAAGRQQKTPTEAAHPKHGEAQAWREFGAGERSHDRMAVPLCGADHRGRKGEHDTGQRAYWDGLGIRLTAFVPALQAAYDAGEDGAAVVRRFAGAAK